MKATWGDSEKNSSKEDEEVKEMENLCLMSKENELSSNEENEVIKNFTLDELHDAFDDLHDKFQKLSVKYVALKNSSNTVGFSLCLNVSNTFNNAAEHIKYKEKSKNKMNYSNQIKTE